jgi:DNA-binding HxlR family transcriptional regulator
VSPRSYGQYCPIAHTLDVVGDRWTLLIVRELLGGPQRYTDLQRALPGIAPNLLATRLRDLAASGIVTRRELPPPAARTVVELTETGRRLERVVVELARWGLSRLDPPGPNDRVTLAAAVRIGLLGHGSLIGRTGVDRTWLVIRSAPDREDVDRAVTIRASEGRLRWERRTAERPDLVVTVDPAELVRLRLDGETPPGDTAPVTFVPGAPSDLVEEFLDIFDLG